MSDLNRKAGQTIDAQRRSLAEAVVSRQYQLQPGLRERYGEAGQAKCVQDAEYHLAYLAAAVTFSSPALFSDYIAWAKAVLAAFGVGPKDVEANLICLRDILNESLPGGMGQVVVPCLDAALLTLPDVPTALPSVLDGADALTGLARQYLQALLRAERHEANRLILDAVRAGVTVSDIYLQVFQRCQREVGRLWQLKQITVAQEHYCTAATQVAMAQLYPASITTWSNRSNFPPSRSYWHSHTGKNQPRDTGVMEARDGRHELVGKNFAEPPVRGPAAIPKDDAATIRLAKEFVSLVGRSLRPEPPSEFAAM